MRSGALQRDRTHLEVVRQSVTTAATLAHERMLPVVDSLASVVPSGQLQRGSTVAVHGVGATSFALALAGETVREGSFMAIVAPRSFGLAACLDFGIPLRRVVQFVLPEVGPTGAVQGNVLAAIIEGFDVVMLAGGPKVATSQARQLLARNRERGSLLMRVGGAAWPDAEDLRFEVTAPNWSGLGQGHGYLQARQVSVQVAGRRYHGAARAHSIMLPAIEGGVASGGVESGADGRQVERFAGADIDAMLDVVDGADSNDLGEIA